MATCPFKLILPALERQATPTLQALLRQTGGEAEAVLVLHCKTCDCVHTTIYSTGGDKGATDRAAFAALYEALRLVSNEVQQQETENNVEEKTSIQKNPHAAS